MSILHDIFVTDLCCILRAEAVVGWVVGCVEAGGNRDNQQVRLTARYDGHKLPRHIRSIFYLLL